MNKPIHGAPFALAMLLVLAGLTACLDKDDEEQAPCDQYVEYICECLNTEDCRSMEETYEDADSDLQDECESQLDNAREAARDCTDGGESG